METVLYLAHTESDGSLSKASLEALGAAVDFAVDSESALAVGLFGAETQQAANSISNCSVTRMLTVSGPDFGQPRYSTDAAAAEILCRAAQASIVVTAGTARIA